MGFIVSMIWTLAIVGIIIFFHELGHFLAAKRLGITVERFSIGFGPKMIGFTRGDTEYRISWLPFFGGYVKMLGENANERPDGETTEPEPEPEAGRFDLAPVSHRVIVALAGPGMNIVLAVLMFAAMYMVGLPAEPDTNIAYVEADSPASEAGIMRNDRVLSVDGYKVKTWSDIQENVMTRPGEELEITLLRNENEKKILRATPEHMQIPVISVSLDLQSELDNSIISGDLMQEFGFNRIPLHSNAVVLAEEPGAKWLLTDGDKKYFIRKEDGNLEIYRETESEDVELAFSVSLALRNELVLQGQLDNNVAPDSLRQKFGGIKAALSQDASLTVEEPGSKWLIADKKYGRGVLKWLIPSKDKRYHVKREDNKLNVYLETGFGMLGMGHSPRAIVRKLESGSTVAKAGLRLDDVIEAVNHKEVTYDSDFVQELQDVSGASVVLTVRRDGGTVEMPIPLEYDENSRLVSFKGLSFTKVERRNPIAAFTKAVPQTIRMGGKIFQFLKRMIVGDISTKYIAGPLGIVQIALAVVETGVASTLQFAGFLSVNLGIVNLLPLFITDGAMIVLLIIEALRRKPMNRRGQIVVQQVGLGFIVLLFLLVTYNDIVRIVTGGL